MRWLQSQLLFKVFSSAKLAVPALLLIAVITSYGTILESQYNADYAKLIVYDSWWFRGLLFVLGMTIFLSTLSRWPWKKRHIGFLVTHLGMIILLIGSVVTMMWGIDGHMQVFEGASGNQVTLKEKVFEFAGPRDFKKILVPQSASRKTDSSLVGQNRQLEGHFKILEYIPFVKESGQTQKPVFRAGRLLSFRLQSQFFDQQQWLHENDQPEIQMGPALIRIVHHDQVEKKIETKTAKKTIESAPGASEVLLIFDQNGQEIVRKTLAQGQSGFKVGDVKVKIKNVFRYATVSDNKISEGAPGEPNPALEVEYTAGGETTRDIHFAKFPEFSIQKENKIGIRGVYQADLVMPKNKPPPAASQGATARNVIEFILPKNENDGIVLHLLKDGKTVLRQLVQLNEAVETPWMGMKITLTKFNPDALSENSAATDSGSEAQIVAIEPIKKQNFLPPSAIRVLPLGAGANAFWLIEGQVKEVTVQNEAYQVYYGPNTIRLPFSLNLKKFHKVDYPGTETAMTFASDVAVSGQLETITISMNEPLKQDGYTLYQSSYDLQPGRPALSVFSVNRDPGRWIKYLGSLILALGIITYTIMRSRLAKKEA